MRPRLALHLVPVALIVIAVLALAAAGLREWRSTPWTGLKCELMLPSRSPEARLITGVAPASPAARAGIRAGQFLRSVEGHTPIPGPELTRLRDRLRPGDELTVSVSDTAEGAPRQVTLVLSSQMSHPVTLIRLTASLVTLLGFLTIGGLVFWRRPADIRARLLLWFSAFVGPFYLLLDAFGFRMTLSGDSQMISAFRIMLLATVLGSIPTALLGHFALVFPRRRPLLAGHPKVLGLLYGFYGVTAALAAVSLWFLIRGAWAFERTGDMDDMSQAAGSHLLAFSNWGEAHPWPALALTGLLAAALAAVAWPWVRGLLRRESWAALCDRPLLVLGTFVLAGAFLGLGPLLVSRAWLPEPIGKPLGIAGVLTVMLGPLVVAIAVPLIHSLIILGTLVRSYRESGVEERRQIRWPVWGIIVYFVAGTALFFVQGLIYGRAFWMIPITDVGGKAMALLVPLSFAFAIARYRLMDIDLVIRKSVAYAGLTIIVGGVFLLLAFGAGGLLAAAAGLEGRWTTLGAGIVTLALVFPLRSRVQRRLEGWVFRQRQRFPEILDSLERSLQAASQDKEIAGATAEAVQEGIPNRGVTVLLASGRERLLRPQAKVGDVPEIARLQLTVDPDSLDRLVPGTEPYPLEAIRSGEEGHARLAAQLGAQSLLPLRSGDRLLGLVTLGRLSAIDEIGAPERRFLGEVGRRAARRLDEVTLQDQAHDLVQARRIQQNLLPGKLPQLPGVSIAARYMPCQDVGGDYYDVVPMDRDRVAVVIADVSGKGVPAALLMSNCQAAFRSLAGLGLTPAELCGRLNEVMASNVAAEQFVTLCYAEIDPRSGSLSIVNAGHVRPALLHPDGRYDLLDLPGGLPLGIMTGERYEECSLHLSPRATLLLFTDGVNEAESPSGARFDESALQETLPRLARLAPADGVDRLFDELRRFTAEDPADDVTVVALSLA